MNQLKVSIVFKTLDIQMILLHIVKFNSPMEIIKIYFTLIIKFKIIIIILFYLQVVIVDSFFIVLIKINKLINGN